MREEGKVTSMIGEVTGMSSHDNGGEAHWYVSV